MPPEIDPSGVAWRVAAAALCVALNGFFVAAEFGLVKVHRARVEALAEKGWGRARTARHILDHLDHYLSSCQLGITMASLALGALGEPAVAALLLMGAGGLGLAVGAEDPLLHGAAFALAFAAITMLHMTVGEQAPKLWALQRAEPATLNTAWPLWLFSRVFGPFIAVVNRVSNGLLWLVGIPVDSLGEGSHTAEELRALLESSARAGFISPRQRELVANVLELVDLEVRHVLVPRVDVVFVSLQRPARENLAVMEKSGHSRFPVCEVGLDTIVGLVHAKDLIAPLRAGREVDFRGLARPAVYVPETQPLSRFIIELQDARAQCAVVLDERGTCTGLAFLEDAVEEIVGPIQDEFDSETPDFVQIGPDSYDVSGRIALPEAASRLGLDVGDSDADTLGGYVVGLLRRLPRLRDQVTVGDYRLTVEKMRARMIDRLRVEPVPGATDPSEAGGKE